MALVTITLTLEIEMVRDAVEDLTHVRERLFNRHGDEFRRLARDIDQYAEHPEHPSMHHLGDGIFTAAPPPLLMALLERARKLSV